MVETSLLESALSFGVYEAAHVAATGERPPDSAKRIAAVRPIRSFQTADGWITVGAAQRISGSGYAPSSVPPSSSTILASPTNTDRVATMTSSSAAGAAVQGQAVSTLARRTGSGRAFRQGRCLHFEEAMADPHVVARGMAVDTQHPAAGTFKTLGIPVKLSLTPGELRRPAPRLGEHTEEVLGRTVKLRSRANRRLKLRHRSAAARRSESGASHVHVTRSQVGSSSGRHSGARRRHAGVSPATRA